MGVTLGVNLFVAWYEAREGRRLGSAFLVADSAHTRSDIYVTLGVVASFVAGARRPRLGRPAGRGPDRRVHRVAGVRDPALGLRHAHRPRRARRREELAAARVGRAGRASVREVRTRGGRDAVYVDLIVHLDGGMTACATPTTWPTDRGRARSRRTRRSWTWSCTSSRRPGAPSRRPGPAASASRRRRRRTGTACAAAGSCRCRCCGRPAR